MMEDVPLRKNYKIAHESFEVPISLAKFKEILFQMKDERTILDYFMEECGLQITKTESWSDPEESITSDYLVDISK